MDLHEAGQAHELRRKFPALAARVAAKEAVLKALGSALEAAGHEVPGGWRMSDIEVVSRPGSPPGPPP